MIWLVGANGMLGKEFVCELQNQGLSFCATDLEVDITDVKALRKYSVNKGIRWIINTAAYTAVDKAENEEEKAYAINALGPGCLGEVAQELDATVIHFSTDYVFDGYKQGAYLETDSVNPVSTYGRTKLAGEVALQQATDKYFIFRISWLYGRFGGNFVSTMLRLFCERDELGIVSDQYGAPTWTKILAQNIVRLLKESPADVHEYGIYHYSDDGNISWYDFSSAIYKEAYYQGLIEKEVQISPITTADYPMPACRPANSVFDKTKIRKLGFEVHPWLDNLRQYLKYIQ